MDLMGKVEYLKTSVSPADVADMFGFEVAGGKILSPFHPDERTPSCHLYEDHWFDYASGNGGDVIDLAIRLSGKPWGVVINMLGTGAEASDFEPGRVRKAAKAEPVDLTEAYNGMAMPRTPVDALAFPLAGVNTGDLSDRVWSFDSMGNVLIPHRSEVGIHGIKIRYRDGGKGAVPGSQFGHALYAPFSGCAHNTAVLTEGESDCWALWQTGIFAEVMALPSGAGLWRDAWLEQLARYEKVYTAFDNDRAGKEATEKVRRAVGWGRWKELPVPQLYNDVREAITAGWNPKLPY